MKWLSSRLNTIQIGTTHIDYVTSDVYMQRVLKRDSLRHFGVSNKVYFLYLQAEFKQQWFLFLHSLSGKVSEWKYLIEFILTFSVKKIRVIRKYDIVYQLGRIRIEHMNCRKMGPYKTSFSKSFGYFVL